MYFPYYKSVLFYVYPFLVQPSKFMIRLRSIRRLLIMSAAYLFLSSCKEDVRIKCDDCQALVCLVNGKKFTQKATGWKQSVLSAFTYGDKRLDISANNLETNEFIGMSLSLADDLRVGTYPLSTYPPGGGLYGDGFKLDYSTDATNTGELTITRLAYGDRPVMEGTFHYQCIDSFTKQSTSVTNGSFRVFFNRVK